MKTHIKKLFLLPALMVCLGLILTGRATAQTFTTLYNFAGAGPTGNNSDGAYPVAGLIISGNTLYGAAMDGGTNGFGTLFAIVTNGSRFTNFYNFTALSAPWYDNGTNSDGANPQTGLILSGNTLYGITDFGGSLGAGTVFGVNTNGSGFTTFQNLNGANETSLSSRGFILSGNTLYGTTYLGGANYEGLLFAINTNGQSFTTLHDFNELVANQGSQPVGGLVFSGTNLYGESSADVYLSSHTVLFTTDTGGSSFSYLHVFNPASGTTTNSGGALPNGGLILSGNILYGTTVYGGTGGYGTVFAVNTSGSGFTTLYNFTNGIDGANPVASLTLLGNTLYGTTTAGGSAGNGTVFAVNINAMTLTNLHSFTATINSTNSDGADPQAGLILSGNTLYGTASKGGTGSEGTVFSISLGVASAPPPQLTIIRSGTNVILTWPTNATGFTLQSTTNLVSPVAWSTVSGQNAVTNPISGTRKFYRLSE